MRKCLKECFAEGELLTGKQVWFYSLMGPELVTVAGIDPFSGWWELRTKSGTKFEVRATDEYFMPYLDPPKLEPKAAVNKCTCDIHLLMREGCRCGQIERERNNVEEVVIHPSHVSISNLPW